MCIRDSLSTAAVTLDVMKNAKYQGRDWVWGRWKPEGAKSEEQSECFSNSQCKSLNSPSFMGMYIALKTNN